MAKLGDFFSAVLKALEPNEAEAKVTAADPEAEKVISGVSTFDYPYMRDTYTRILDAAKSIDPESHIWASKPVVPWTALGTYNPNTHDIMLAPGIVDAEKPDLSYQVLSHELLHFLFNHDATSRKSPLVDVDTQHRLIDVILDPQHIKDHSLRAKDLSKEDLSILTDFLGHAIPAHAPHVLGPNKDKPQ